MSTYAFEENGHDLAKYLAEELKAETFFSANSHQRGGSVSEFAVNDIVPDDVLRDFVGKYYTKCGMTVLFQESNTAIEADIMEDEKFIMQISVHNYTDNSFRRIKVKIVLVR